MSNANNRRKDELLDEPHGTAAGRLRKAILFHYLVCVGHDYCFRCHQRIERIEDLSIEHKTAWQSAPDPRAAFFNLDNIAFSHLRCNVDSRIVKNGNSYKAKCHRGHPLVLRNRGQRRTCQTCERNRMRQFRSRTISR